MAGPESIVQERTQSVEEAVEKVMASMERAELPAAGRTEPPGEPAEEGAPPPAHTVALAHLTAEEYFAVTPEDVAILVRVGPEGAICRAQGIDGPVAAVYLIAMGEQLAEDAAAAVRGGIREAVAAIKTPRAATG
jgi:hypothetical protein